VEDGKPVYADRLIDIDILIYGFHEIESEELTIPHPAMLQRDFVMIPLREIVDEETWEWINRTQ
jgi:2-amino-4-hydroxy-6-hydroxymethyldihydropteridine diphosphokinase